MTPDKLKRTDEWNSKDILFCIAKEPQQPRVWLGSSDFGVYEFDTSQEKPEWTAFTGEGHQSYVGLR